MLVESESARKATTQTNLDAGLLCLIMAARYVPPTPEFVEMVKGWHGGAIPEGYEVHNDVESALKPPYFWEDARTIFWDSACNAHVNQDGHMLDIDELRRVLCPEFLESISPDQKRMVTRADWKHYVARGYSRDAPIRDPPGPRRRTPFKAAASKRPKHLYRNARQIPVERLSPGEESICKRSCKESSEILRMRQDMNKATRDLVALQESMLAAQQNMLVFQGLV